MQSQMPCRTVYHGRALGAWNGRGASGAASAQQGGMEREDWSWISCLFVKILLGLSRDPSRIQYCGGRKEVRVVWRRISVKWFCCAEPTVS